MSSFFLKTILESMSVLYSQFITVSYKHVIQQKHIMHGIFANERSVNQQLDDVDKDNCSPIGL